MDERDYKAMNKELQEETEKNCIGCKWFNYIGKNSAYCLNKKSEYLALNEKGPSCELKQIRK